MDSKTLDRFGSLQMKVIILGGSGELGVILSHAFQHSGHEVVAVSRSPIQSTWRSFQWDAKTLGAWCLELDGADAVINLAGRSVNCRYTSSNKREIMQSRVLTTRLVGEAIASARRPPRVWLQASTATIYSHRYDSPNDETNGTIGGAEPGVPDSWRFSIEVARAWEQAVDEADVPGTRKVKLRAAMVMGPRRGGTLDTLLSLVRFGLGGQAADGRQYVSWIHYLDFVEAVRWIISHEAISDVINVAAPNPLPNAEFMRELRGAWGMPFGMPASRLMLEAGAFLLRSETELILKSRRVVPGILTQAGFPFRFPSWHEASHDLCNRVRQNRAPRA